MNKLIDRARTLSPIVRVGKNGLTTGILEEISRQLEKHKLIKIKLLKAFIDEHDKNEAGAMIAKKCNGEILQVIGNIIVLHYKK